MDAIAPGNLSEAGYHARDPSTPVTLLMSSSQENPEIRRCTVGLLAGRSGGTSCSGSMPDAPDETDTRAGLYEQASYQRDIVQRLGSGAHQSSMVTLKLKKLVVVRSGTATAVNLDHFTCQLLCGRDWWGLRSLRGARGVLLDAARAPCLGLLSSAIQHKSTHRNRKYHILTPAALDKEESMTVASMTVDLLYSRSRTGVYKLKYLRHQSKDETSQNDLDESMFCMRLSQQRLSSLFSVPNNLSAKTPCA